MGLLGQLYEKEIEFCGEHFFLVQGFEHLFYLLKTVGGNSKRSIHIIYGCVEAIKCGSKNRSINRHLSDSLTTKKSRFASNFEFRDLEIFAIC